jgi:membrane-associated phospholipid phosphatase
MRPPAYASDASAPAGGRALDAGARRGLRLHGWRAEALLFGLAFLAYQGARALGRGSPEQALAHAHQVLGAEAALGIDVEGSVQGALLGTPWLSALDWVYLAAQSVALAAGIVLVYRASRPVYRVLRTTLLATWLLALPVYVLYATAPPRLAGLGITDSVSESTPIVLSSGSTTALYNPYAAVPSLHAGFALALGIAVAVSARSRAVRIAGALWGPLVIVAVVATGNHFLIDVAAGLLLTALGFAVALCLRRRAAATDSAQTLARRGRCDLHDSARAESPGSGDDASPARRRRLGDESSTRGE